MRHKKVYYTFIYGRSAKRPQMKIFYTLIVERKHLIFTVKFVDKQRQYHANRGLNVLVT